MFAPLTRYSFNRSILGLRSKKADSPIFLVLTLFCVPQRAAALA